MTGAVEETETEKGTDETASCSEFDLESLSLSVDLPVETKPKQHRGSIGVAASVVLLVIAFVVGLSISRNAHTPGCLLPPLRAPPGCDHPVFCQGLLLRAVQMARVFNDSKTFVDRPIRTSVSAVLEAFSALGANPTREQLSDFVEAHFLEAGVEVQRVDPADWQPQPSFLTKIKDNEYRAFASAVHGKWKKLVRRFNRTGLCDDCVSSIPLNTTFVVPGGRFREFYYWDTFWILEGLFVSQMFETAKQVLLGMLDMVDRYGFIPNGARIYYLNRSQPPMLIQMVRRYVEESGDTGFIADHIATLRSELDWWEAHRKAPLPGAPQLNHYAPHTTTPRPESYYEDTVLAAGLPAANQSVLWSEIAGAAESGWDFSSRWFAGRTLSTVQTSKIVPADLNSILLYNEETLSDWLRTLGDAEGAAQIAARASQRRDDIRKWLWNESAGQWFDYDAATGAQRTSTFYVSNFVPLWAGQRTGPMAGAAVKSLRDALMPGGYSTSDVDTGEQWDFPNAWPPLQHFAAKGLLRTGLPEAEPVAAALVSRWVESNYCGWKLTQPDGHMFEKYDARAPGVPGGGGEYEVQAGFGWTNGVVLWMLREYGSNITAPQHCNATVGQIRAAIEAQTTRQRLKRLRPV